MSTGRTGAGPSKSPNDDWYIRIGLYVIAGCCIAAAFLHAFFPTSFDQTTAMFLALAAVVIIIREISEAEMFGIKWKTKQRLAEAEKRMDVIEAVGGLPGRRTGARPPTDEITADAGSAPLHSKRSLAKKATSSDRQDDPNKGKFGGKSVSNNRILEAEIEPVAGKSSAACTVTFRVRSTDPNNHPLEGEVEFHLHPSFDEWTTYPVDVEDGVAEDEITSWGAFTIGAVADGGNTRLELDLMQVKGGTKKFYAN